MLEFLVWEFQKYIFKLLVIAIKHFNKKLVVKKMVNYMRSKELKRKTKIVKIRFKKVLKNIPIHFGE